MTITIVGNSSPTVAIESPQDGNQYFLGGEVIPQILFSGTGNDVEDGILAGESLVWTSSIDGQIGTGNSFNYNDLSAETHTITLTATDSQGAQGSDSVSIIISAEQ